MASMTLICFICTQLACMSNANEFLKATPKDLSERVSEEDIRTSLLQEIEGTLGTGATTSRVSVLETMLKPTYMALPKNEHGNLGHSTVRYALHRIFVLRHGWNIKGLGRNAGASNSTSPAGVLKDQVPTYIQGLFEKRLEGKGLGLHELAVLAATIEHLIHNEAVSKLGAAFNVHRLLPTGSLSEGEANEVLDTYMMAYILGENLTNMSLRRARKFNAKMPEIFLAWNDTQKFVRDIRANITKKRVSSPEQPELDFATLAKVADVVGEQFGSFQNAECQQLKTSLMKMEHRGTGRVKLSDFYKPALDGSWQFQESVGYLRQLGTIDESDSSDPSVIIANYLASHANCIASSGFYSVCCKDECEGLLGHVEEQVAAPEATPAVIALLVANMPSSTVASPRTLSSTLLKRLDEIAEEHGGTVPLHSRLFSQWMHHAYPRECPYPHLSSTTSQQTADEWLEETDSDSTASREEMLQYMTTQNATEEFAVDAVEELLPWSTEEELLVVRSSPQLSTHTGSTPQSLRSIVLFAVLASLAFGLVQTFKVTHCDHSDLGSTKFIV